MILNPPTARLFKDERFCESSGGRSESGVEAEELNCPHGNVSRRNQSNGCSGAAAVPVRGKQFFTRMWVSRTRESRVGE